MIATDPALDLFVSEHRWGVLTTLRRDGSPASSVVAYARDADTLVISTPGGTFKRRSLDRDPRATLCIISNHEPFNYVSVTGRVTVETDDLVGPTRMVFANIADVGYSEPENLPQWLDDQDRVILRLRPERTAGVLR